MASIRSIDTYGGEQSFGIARFRLPGLGCLRSEVVERIAALFQHGGPPGRVLCVPFFPDELMAALAVHEIFQSPLAVYLMDDHNVYSRAIPDGLMAEALAKSALRLAISREMQRAYEDKFGYKFWILPPLVAGPLIRSEPHIRRPAASATGGVLVGNVWFQPWLDALRHAVRTVGVQIDWYSNLDNSGPLKFDISGLARDGIRFHPPLPESELAAILPGYEFAVVPSGVPGDGDAARAIAQLSLPSRLAFLVAAGNLPCVVLGGAGGAAAAFVRRFDVGATCAYDGAELQCAVAEVRQRGQEMRHNAARIAAQFSADGMADWFWQSLDVGEPRDLRFEQLFAE